MVWSVISIGATIAIKGRLSRFMKTTSGQTLIALSFNIISLFAGGLVSVFTPQFSLHTWILALFPPILTVRGGIGGIFSGNLSTMLHLGLIKPQITNNTKEYWTLIKSVLVITIIDAIILGFVSFIFNIFIGRTELNMFLIFLLVPTIACILAICVSIPVTSIIAIETFKRGLDPDILVYPILASINDIVVTIFFVLTVSLVLNEGFLFTLLIYFFFIIILTIGYIGFVNRNNRTFSRNLKEGAFIIIISSILGSFNGVLLSNLNKGLSAKPGLVILYPALTNSLGNIGSIIGSRFTTDIALGMSINLIDGLRNVSKSIIFIEVPAALMHVVFAIISFILAGPGKPGVSFFFLLTVALFTNLLSFILISSFAIIIAHQSFVNGLNPDNVVIPTITSVSDTTATIIVNPALVFAKLLGL